MIRRRFMNKAGEVKIIEFTINDTSYQAEEGMTWREWVDSEYNNTTLHISNSYNTVTSDAMHYVQNSSGELVYGTDVIIENEYYIIGGSSN